MRKYAYATLCGTLLFSGKAAFAIETSLLDRLAQERIIGDGQARPQAYPVPHSPARRAQPARPRRPAPTRNSSASCDGRTNSSRNWNRSWPRRNRQRAAHRAAGAAAGQGSRSPESSALAAEQEQNQARIRELGQRQDTQAQRDALAAELASARTATAGNASQDSALSAALGAARTEIASLKQQATDLQAANQQLRDQQLRDQQAAQAAQQAKTDKTGGAGRVVINDTAPRTCASAMRSAPGTRKARRRNPEVRVHRQEAGPAGVLAGLHRQDQQSPAAAPGQTRPNSTARNSSWKPPCCPRMKKSKVLLAAAAKEKGAVKMPDGVIYRILDKGKSPSVSDKNEILFDIEEQLSTGEELVRETRSSHVRTCRRCSRASSSSWGLAARRRS